MSGLVTIVIVNYNGGTVLPRCLESLAATLGRVPHEIVVVDNDSKDGSAEVVARRFPEARLILAGENLGFSRGCNLGAAQARGEFLLFLNADTVAREDFLTPLLECLRENPQAAAAGPALVHENGAPQISAGEHPSVLREALDKLRYMRAARRAGEWGEGSGRRAGAAPRPRPVGWATGACLLVRAGQFREIGGFDERIFMYFEDKDLCRRLIANGGKVLYCPAARLEHALGGSSPGADRDRLRRIYLESQAYYYRKHHGPVQNALLRLYRRMA